MKPVDPQMLIPGFRLPQHVFARSGIKLLSAGTVLTESMCRTLAGSQHGGLYFANSVDELAQGLEIEPVAQLIAGMRAPSDVVTRGGVVAVQSGQLIEDHHAEAMEEGAYKLTQTHEARRARARRMRLAEELIASCATAWENVPLRVTPGEPSIQLHDAGATGWPSVGRLTAFREDRVRAYRRILARLLAGQTTAVADPLSLVDELIEKLKQHPERFAQLALLTRRSQDYLPDHAYTTACLSISIAARLGWGEPDVRLVGLAGLLADVGMAMVSRDIRTAQRPLTDVETNQVFRHPVQGVVLLESLHGLPEAVRVAVYQHHERDNGAGYPQALRGSKIHDYAKVIGVADAFGAATEQRPYRRGRRPYDTIEELVSLSSQKLYDRKIVRALVESVGLYPVGSYIRLNTGQTAQVIGVHAKFIDRPIVSVSPSGETDRDCGIVLDLTEHEPWELHVMGAIDDPYIMWTAA